MNSRTFFEKVALMREAQKDYFRTKSRDALRKSKALEAEIDHEIERVRAMATLRRHNLNSQVYSLPQLKVGTTIIKSNFANDEKYIAELTQT